MNNSIQKLYSIANKNERLIIGLMSGTSMDGLDIALCCCKDHGSQTQVELLNFITMPYQDDFRADVKSIFSRRDADLQKVCLLNEWIGLTHANLILEALKKWNVSAEEVDMIASHGQTIFHAPKSLHQLDNYPNATLQIGDGDHIAVKTGIITISDFRQKHLAAGGEGAPLAVYGDYLIFSKTGEDRIMLNIGGIANFTFLPGDRDASRVFSTDVGPGNTLMDHFIQQNYPGEYYDQDGKIAKSGNLNSDLLNALLKNDFFSIDFPKTTGPELFSLTYLMQAQELSNTIDLAKEDVLATLCHFSAKGIINAIMRTIDSSAIPKIFMSGGGMHNPLLVALLKEALPNAIFSTTDELEINPDAKEAVLFALLANETLAGNPINFGEREGVPSVCMGKISLP
ncbi:anhydro-N-acetylmuramic acid kinase [Pedobacter frigiditerrae]|uniref:Anhydro-N-acetylmuramic acid kinase n=1 Tax=Pedobacter frigiditerrae TaxID=2530452 RepID=A0A4R0N3R9_9SPHI|nr:anhydro-N-acetylmuramic acid kinase [Pedobacter frigiditerrae]TCC94013.1 anhydro-N-acetylmuramic acid kinase [Pedobacter frigiditerrae]